MQAKEKARDLVDKFQKEIPDYLYKGAELNMAAKACAIICVETVLSEADKYGGFNVECENDEGYACSPLERKQFWQSVLEELKK